MRAHRQIGTAQPRKRPSLGGPKGKNPLGLTYKLLSDNVHYVILTTLALPSFRPLIARIEFFTQ